MKWVVLLLAAMVSLPGCKKEPVVHGQEPSGKTTGATDTTQQGEEAQAEPTTPVVKKEEPAPVPPPTPQQLRQETLRAFLGETGKILERDEQAPLVKVHHVLLSWRQLSPAYKGKMDPRGAERNKEEANTLATELFQELKEGASITALMKEHSEDPGSAEKGSTYTVTPTAGFVPPFKRVSLRLKVGEAALIESLYGWHLIQRAE